MFKEHRVVLRNTESYHYFFDAAPKNSMLTKKSFYRKSYPACNILVHCQNIYQSAKKYLWIFEA